MTVRRNFIAFVSEVKKEFANNITIDIETVKNEIMYFYPDNADIANADLVDMAAIISKLIKSREWNYLNCDHLCEIVKDYGNRKMKKAEEKYRQQYDHFLCTTKLEDYLALNTTDVFTDSKNRSLLKGKRRSSSEYRNRLSFKLKVDVSKETLMYIEELWKRARHHGLPKVGVVLDNIYNGCVEVCWIILHPNIALEFKKKAVLPEAVEFYKENKIIRVLLNEDCLYSTTEDLTASVSSDVFKLPTSESIEEEPEEIGMSESDGTLGKEKPEELGLSESDETLGKEKYEELGLLESDETLGKEESEEIGMSESDGTLGKEKPEEHLETVIPVTVTGEEEDKVKSKEKADTIISEEPVKAKPTTKEKGTAV